MKILVAEDDAFQRAALEALLLEWGDEVVLAADGEEAWRALQAPDAPSVALLDGQMPRLSGPELCARLRAETPYRPRYLLLLTASGAPADVQKGLDAGANDYIRKPFEELELKARLRVGLRTVSLEAELSQRVQELERATERIRTLEGILPICSYCKKIRDDENYWQSVESYISRHTGTRFSHGVCPSCYQREVEPQFDVLGGE